MQCPSLITNIRWTMFPLLNRVVTRQLLIRVLGHAPYVRNLRPDVLRIAPRLLFHRLAFLIHRRRRTIFEGCKVLKSRLEDCRHRLISSQSWDLTSMDIRFLQQGSDGSPRQQYCPGRIFLIRLPHFLVHLCDRLDLLVHVQRAIRFQQLPFPLFNMFSQRS